MKHILSAKERKDLQSVLSMPNVTEVKVWGKGEHRFLSFYAVGTRLEVRVPFPADGETEADG